MGDVLVRAARDLKNKAPRGQVALQRAKNRTTLADRCRGVTPCVFDHCQIIDLLELKSAPP